MILKQNHSLITLERGDSRFCFLETGDVWEWIQNNIRINMLTGNPCDGSINNLWLRVYEADGIRSFPLMGIKSGFTVQKGEHSLVFAGRAGGFECEVAFELASEGIFFLTAKVSGKGTIDFVWGQDVGIADPGAIRANPLYVSQYIDHSVIKGENGCVSASRQNMKQGGRNPYIQLGCMDREIISYSTDGMQFFGKEYKKTDEPEALKADLPGSVYQYEVSYIGLQSEKIEADGEAKISFYGCFKEHHEDAVSGIEFTEEIRRAFELREKEELTDVPAIVKRELFGAPYASSKMEDNEIEKLYPERKFTEKKDGRLLSFFTGDHRHVVTQAKELLTERPHGHIITSGVDEEKVNTRLITSTNYMYGIFTSQNVVGNTNLNKFTSTPCSPLNLLKNSGQRIYIKRNGTYRLLTMPALYELGVNHARWYYRIGKDMLRITSYTACDESDLILEVSSVNGESYDFLVTNQLTMCCDEFMENVEMEREGNTLIFTPCDGSFMKSVYPGIAYRMYADRVFAVCTDEIFYEDQKTRNGTLLGMEFTSEASFSITLQGILEGEKREERRYDFRQETEKFEALYRRLTGGFHVSVKGEGAQEIDKLNEVFCWYTHNALTHYAVPHGLEQPGGAAWGTRDACQGPFEFFLAVQNHKLCREILLTVFSHQFLETGEWPQWFMFDRYQMQQDDSHGDIVFWPLKILGDYIKASGDYEVLNEMLAYRHFPDGRPAEEESLLDHVRRAVKSIEGRFLYDTHLITYAGGDWDDTLQPASKELAEKLVSSWTMALAYQTLHQLAQVTPEADFAFAAGLNSHAEGIKKDFREKLTRNGVTAGFAHVEDPEHISFMLSPEDQETGIHYRLLPMTRSIIAELADEEQAERNVLLIDENLKCKDGIRLMDRPARYRGGVITYFRRAEQASNVGREIGLQYVHAHIRYIEAMAKLGKREKVWESIYQILPIDTGRYVENACLRQSNCYYSSSEGAFTDRYDYQDNFGKLRTGGIPVKAGWRIYSSGPGIFIHQLVSNVLGIRIQGESLILDPVLPEEIEELTLDFTLSGKPVRICYRTSRDAEEVSGVTLNGKEIHTRSYDNGYRCTGVRMSMEEIESGLAETGNHMEIKISEKAGRLLGESMAM